VCVCVYIYIYIYINIWFCIFSTHDSGFFGLFPRDRLTYFLHFHRRLQRTLSTFDIDICRHLNRHLCTPLCERPELKALTVWRLQHTVTSTVQAAKGWQRQLRLPTTPSGGTCMIACMLHKSQKASSNLSHLTKKVTWARCGDEESF